ncbi:Vesicle-associated protein 4-3 [Bienertia sinuspersici]
MAIDDQRSEGGDKVWGLFKLPFRQTTPSISSSGNSGMHSFNHNNNKNGDASNTQATTPSVSSVARSLLPTRRRLRLDPSNKLYFPWVEVP